MGNIAVKRDLRLTMRYAVEVGYLLRVHASIITPA